MSRDFGRFWDPARLGSPRDRWPEARRRFVAVERPGMARLAPDEDAPSEPRTGIPIERRAPASVERARAPEPRDLEPPRATESAELERARRQLAEQAAVELERAKERIAREADREVERAKRELILGFLEVLDDLDRALAAAHQSGDAAAVVRGIELVREGFLEKLRQAGVTPSHDRGKLFDPSRHEAVAVVPANSHDTRGQVIEVLRTGYLLDGEVLRPARVTVER